MQMTRAIPDFPGYEMSDRGEVWSVKYGRRNRLSEQVDADGYHRVELWVCGKRFNRSVHALVLMAFVGPRPEGMEGCHDDGNPENNRLGNLRWGTPKENQGDRLRHGTDCRGSRHGAAKLTEEVVLELRANGLVGETLSEASVRLGVSVGTVHGAMTGRTWRHVPAPETSRAA